MRQAKLAAGQTAEEQTVFKHLLGTGHWNAGVPQEKKVAHIYKFPLFHRNSIKLLSSFRPSEGKLVWFINTADGAWAHTCFRM